MITHSRPCISDKEKDIADKILSSKKLNAGSYTEKFENELAKFTKAPYCIAVSSGTAALYLVLKANGIGKGDKVIIPDYVCSSVYFAVKWTGADAVPAECSCHGLILGDKIKKSKAVIPVNLYGKLVNIDKFKSIVIEDAAQSFGGTDKYGVSGFRTDIGIVSFYATKLITAGGIGGAIFLKNFNLYKKIKSIRDNDLLKKKYDKHFRFSLPNLNAGIGLVQLKRYKEFIKKRKMIVSHYNNEFRNLPMQLPVFDNNEVPFRYVVKTDKKYRDKFIKYCYKNGVECKIPVSSSITSFMKIRGFKSTQKLIDENISIPLYPDLSDTEIEKIIKTVKKWEHSLKKSYKFTS